jgi:hypothetical protein
VKAQAVCRGHEQSVWYAHLESAGCDFAVRVSLEFVVEASDAVWSKTATKAICEWFLGRV